MRIRVRTLVVLLTPLFLPIIVAYLQWAIVGLPAIPAAAQSEAPPHGFPFWLRVTHYVNFLFMILLIRSGLQILMDHPRLYWNVHCTPGTEWLRLTPVEVPTDRVWTAKDDSRYLSPWIGLPGYRHTIGMARHWHFLSVLFWVATASFTSSLLFGTGQWRRLVPTSWHVIPDAWAYFVHYATFHLPPEPDTFIRYNPLQQLTYFGVVFVLAPAGDPDRPVDVAGPDQSLQVVSRICQATGRSAARSTSSCMCAFVVFIVVHVAMVMLTGFVRNMNHIVVGADDYDVARPLPRHRWESGSSLR